MTELNRNLVIIKDLYIIIAMKVSILLNYLAQLILKTSKLNVLAAIVSTCSLNSKLLSKIIPKSLKLLTTSKETPFRL